MYDLLCLIQQLVLGYLDFLLSVIKLKATDAASEQGSGVFGKT